MVIGKWLNLTINQIREVIKTGLLHDVGKIKIPKSILNKKGGLSVEEYEIVKQHTVMGYEILQPYEELSEGVRLGVLLHHERENGSGYPKGSSGKDTHLYAKIIAVADVYDAITSDRVYQKKSTPFQAFEILRTQIFGKLDSRIVYAFLEKIYTYYIGTEVMLNTGNKGIIIHINPDSISKPIICVGSSYIDLSKEKDVEIKYLL